MKKLDKRWKIILYGCSGLGLNMLNLIVGSYLCSALLVGGFDEHLSEWTYASRDLVVAALWGTLILVMKIVDGIIDIPLASFTDNLKTRWGRRRPAILMGYIPLLISYVLFLIPLTNSASTANTVWFAVMLGIFYCSYTLTMVTYYATFAEIVDNDKDRVLLSNIKSICDVVYFILGFALVPAFVSMGMNVRIIALIFLPLAVTMLIPLFTIKEPSTKDGVLQGEGVGRPAGFIESFVFAFKNKHFTYWLFILAVMNFGLQLFLSGINEFFSSTGINMTFVMASSFVPVPFTLILYNYIIRKKGFRFAFQYILLVYSIGMSLMFFARMLPEAILLPAAIGCAIIVSFAIGAFFSVIYTIPSHLAAEENAKGNVCASSMYFAVQGLFEGVAAGLASGVVLVALKQNGLIGYMTLIVAGACMTAFLMACFLPRSIAMLGKESKQ
ncbi:MAG: MFS transporter [Clostridia bacterium]|nr:MFS transporter [Clostridia bacterium]